MFDSDYEAWGVVEETLEDKVRRLENRINELESDFDLLSGALFKNLKTLVEDMNV